MKLIQSASLIATVAVAVTGLGACQTSPAAPNSELAKTPASGEVVGLRDGVTQLHPGQLLTISLPSNGSTGFSWRLASFDEAVLTPGEPFGTEVTEAHQPPMAGVPGVTHWRFKATAPGQTTLTFTYLQPWETSTPPAETAVYTITVR